MRDTPSTGVQDVERATIARAALPARAPQRLNSAAWAGAGFVAGALFWHSIGFWSFVQATLVPDGNARRASGEPIVSETRASAVASMHSPVRPARTGAKTATKLSEPPHADAASFALAPVAVVLNPAEVANCVSLSRKPGAVAEASPCAPLGASLATGTGVRIGDREAVKSAALLWPAKVDVSANQR
jgi:hypothetical protein